MYRRPKFLEVLLEIRQAMAREADYDVDLFAEMVRAGKFSRNKKGYDLTAKEAEKPDKNADRDKKPSSQRQS